jgi:hypothetical protein
MYTISYVWTVLILISLYNPVHHEIRDNSVDPDQSPWDMDERGWSRSASITLYTMGFVWTVLIQISLYNPVHHGICVNSVDPDQPL